MAAEDSLEVKLDLVTAGATKALDGFKSQFNNSFKAMNLDLGKTASGIGGVAKSLINVKTAAVAAGASIVTYFASKQILSKAIDEENAINGVALALARSGEYSKAALNDVQNFANGLQAQSVYSAAEILNQVSLAKAYGATASQSKLIAQASIELAAVTGKTLDEASAQVTKTLSGQAGQLAKLSPRIKALTSEQLKNGEAARILLEQYGGTAIGKLNTFGGALAQNKNVFEDLLTQVGYLITKNPVVVAGIKALTDVFASLGKYLEANRESIIAFVNEGIVTLLNFAPKIGEGLKFMVATLTVLTKSVSLAAAGFGTLINALINIAPVKVLLDGLVTVVGKIASGFLRLLEVIVDIPLVNKTLKTMGINADTLSQGLNDAALGAANLSDSISVEKISAGIEKMNDFAFSIVEGADAVKEDLNKAIDAGVAKAGALAKAVKGIGSGGPVEMKVVNNEESVKASIENYQGYLELAFGGEKGAKVGDALLSGIANGLKNGKEGARALLSGLAGSAADAFVPGLGKIVGPLIDVLSQGPDAVRDMVKQFAQAIPGLIENIITAVPVLIEELANQLPIIIEKLAERADDIIIALAKAMPKVAIALATMSPKIMLALAKEAPKFVEALVAAIGDAIKDLFGLGKGGVFDGAISGEGGGKGAGGLLSSGPTKSAAANTALNIATLGGSGLATNVYREGKKFINNVTGWKLARGGEIPPGFPNDTAPAMLSSGENVVDRSTNSKLKNFLSENDGGMTAALLIQIRDLLLQPVEVRSSMNINQREFASILLQMARTNQRTS